MKHPERIEDYLEHILEAIDRAVSYVEPLSGLETFQKTPQAQDAVIRNIEIIGEAANRIQKPVCRPHAKADPPWRSSQSSCRRII